MLFRLFSAIAFLFISHLCQSSNAGLGLHQDVEDAYQATMRSFQEGVGAWEEVLHAWDAKNPALAAQILGYEPTEDIAASIRAGVKSYPRILRRYEGQMADYLAFQRLAPSQKVIQARTNFALALMDLLLFSQGEFLRLSKREDYAESTYPQFERHQKNIRIPTSESRFLEKKHRFYFCCILARYYRSFLAPDVDKCSIEELLDEAGNATATLEAHPEGKRALLRISVEEFFGANPALAEFFTGRTASPPHADSVVVLGRGADGRQIPQTRFSFTSQVASLYWMGDEIFRTRHPGDSRFSLAWIVTLSGLAHRSGKGAKSLMRDEELKEFLLKTPPSAAEAARAWAFLDGEADSPTLPPAPRKTDSAGKGRASKGKGKNKNRARHRGARGHNPAPKTSPIAREDGVKRGGRTLPPDAAAREAELADLEAKRLREEAMWRRIHEMNTELSALRARERAAAGGGGGAGGGSAAPAEEEESVGPPTAAADSRVPVSRFGTRTALRRFADLIFMRERVLITGDAILSGLRALANNVDSVTLFEDAEGSRVKISSPAFPHPYTFHIHGGTIAVDAKSTYRELLEAVLVYDV